MRTVGLQNLGVGLTNWSICVWGSGSGLNP